MTARLYALKTNTQRQQEAKELRWIKSIKIGLDTSKGIEAERYVPKMTQQEAHDYVSAKHRKDDFDSKTWWKSVMAWWVMVAIGMALFGLFMGVAGACGEEQPPMKPVKVVSTV